MKKTYISVARDRVCRVLYINDCDAHCPDINCDHKRVYMAIPSARNHTICSYRLMNLEVNNE